ncbi:MAG: XRE family transcriptional regulator, partial [Deltaproteobacteria bacterium]
ISVMENNKRTIGKKRAMILGKALKISYKVFL